MKVKYVLSLTTKDLFIKINDDTNGKIEHFNYPTSLEDFEDYLEREVIGIDTEIVDIDNIDESEYYLVITI